MLRTYFGSGHW